ncbi:phage minor head protein [Gemmatimonas sp.]|uniref:phage minor head protein n=1 Tax=Gemmatimonas sp. TaxID=1962908 RepID=UPI003563BE57
MAVADEGDAITRAIRRHRARLNKSGRRTTSDLLAAYGDAYRSLLADATALGSKIDAARTAGVVVDAVWLQKERRYISLLADIETEVGRFAGDAYKTTLRTVADAVTAAGDDTAHVIARLRRLGSTPAAANVVSAILPTDTIETLAATTTRQAPVGKLFRTIAKDAAEEARTMLLAETAKGTSGKTIARKLASTLQIPLTRATTIVRTEQMRAYRLTAHARYESAGVTEWVWLAGTSGRTCPACWGKHGKRFPIRIPMGSHPNCRCTSVPFVDGVTDITDGETLFGALPAAEKLAVLGPAKMRAYNAGTISLADLAVDHVHAEWGQSVRQASLRELLGTAAEQFYRP